MKNCIIEAPKTFRRTKGINLEGVSMPNAGETLWNCDQIIMKQVSAKGDYFAMNSSNIHIDGFELVGNYSFDGVKNVEIHHAKLLSKDAFWNSENVTVYDSFISGEYLGWNAKNLTMVNCTIESNQGMCYIDNLVMKNCRLLNTTLAFEYSTVDVDVKNTIDSVLNPISGRIRAGKMSHATYLLWLDCSKIIGDTSELCQYLRNKTGLYLSAGIAYGGNGREFLRMNAACPRERLLDGLERLKQGIKSYENYVVDSC